MLSRNFCHYFTVTTRLALCGFVSLVDSARCARCPVAVSIVALRAATVRSAAVAIHTLHTLSLTEVDSVSEGGPLFAGVPCALWSSQSTDTVCALSGSSEWIYIAAIAASSQGSAVHTG